MKTTHFLVTIVLAFLLSACGSDQPATAPTPTTTPEAVVPISSTPEIFYAWVDNLNIREAPKTSAAVVVKVNTGDPLTYLEEKTDFTEKINLRGKDYDEPWLKVKTAAGKAGWVFAGAVKREGEAKGTAKKIAGVVDVPHFGRHDLRVWAKESIKNEAGGDAESTTTVYSSGNWMMKVMEYETGEYGYGKHYRLIGSDSEILKAYNLEWISDTPHLIKETVWDFTSTPAKKYVRSATYEKHFSQLKPRPDGVEGDFLETPLSPAEVKAELEYL